MAGKKSVVFCLKILQFCYQPVKKIRKSRKNNMKQFKIGVFVLVSSSCFITLLLYYWYRSSKAKDPLSLEFHSIEVFKEEATVAVPKAIGILGTPMVHVPLDEVYKYKPNEDYSFEEEDLRRAPMINTPGCQIPVSLIPFKEKLKKIKRKKPGTCGRRAVYLKKISGDKVKVLIKEKVIKTYLRKSAIFECCYRFIHRSSQRGYENRKIEFTPCLKFQDGANITLKSDFVNIQCAEQRKNISHVVYDDVFAFTKLVNITRGQDNTCKRKYNVLLLGMDSMSLSRFSQIMPRTVTFFKENFWLGYRGYHKIGDNTLPNLMTAFTGHNISIITKKCSGNMDGCNDLLIWNKFKNLGYVTAYGEDYLRLPDTFHDKFEFKECPTDHYMRPLFMKGETELFNNSLVCAGKIPSAQQILDYVVDFSMTYRSKSFFGVFWVNSYSHNINSRPHDSDNMFENFFNRLTYTGILDNTFVIFFSDHGIRFGDDRLEVQSYYDERMPFLFIWTPLLFKGKHLPLYKALVINQYSLVTPYDLYHTLVDINHISDCNSKAMISSSGTESCPKCHSLFEVIERNRTCKDAAIHEKWCSCHNLYPLDVADMEGLRSVNLVVTHIKNVSKTVKPKKCWGCMKPSLKSVIRIHFYYDNNKVNLYHVVALSMAPGNVTYEATVLRKGEHAELIGSLSVISPYRGLGKCTTQPKDRFFCVCQKVSSCK